MITILLAYKSPPPLKCESLCGTNIVDLHMCRRWFLRACTGCKLGPMLYSVEAQI